MIFAEALPLLASFLRKNYRTLKLASINSLLSIYKNYGNFISVEQLKTIVIVELPGLLSENDLHISYVSSGSLARSAVAGDSNSCFARSLSS